MIETQGMWIGLMDEIDDMLKDNKLNLNSGDVMFLYTDGITEARNDDQEEFGYDRLKNIIVENAEFPPNEIKESIVKAMYSFCGTNALEDDSTLIIIKFKENKT